MASRNELHRAASTGFKSATVGNKSKTTSNKSETVTHSNKNHITKHVMKLTRNLLVLQKEGICCDVMLQCKDGIIPAHSGTYDGVTRK